MADDIDDLLDEVENKYVEKKKAVTDSRSRAAKPVRRCYPVYLGGSVHQPGQGTSLSQRACDRLRCTACDFKVCMFNNFKWASDTNYLFLRNNAPDFDKLKAKLSPSKGSRAYCCQCCWRTVKDLVQLNDPELKWVCGKH
ncbi:hypothetical protein BaRGS_00010652 [Batillaria attramentaria]|uniref:Cilia- and flagella-associated protein 418 n=1 Tax=Batillaria attramentaria TaxID=370345 RepID=A0ABD0LF23_9CAEN